VGIIKKLNAGETLKEKIETGPAFKDPLAPKIAFGKNKKTLSSVKTMSSKDDRRWASGPRLGGSNPSGRS